MPHADDVSPQELLGRLQALEDERLILQRLYEYGHSIDYGRKKEWLDCFTEDGVFAVHRGTPLSETYRGHAELSAFIGQHTKAPAQYHKHLMIEPRVVIESSSAHADSYFVRLDQVGDRPVLRSFGRYRDDLLRCADGLWRFRQRVVEVEAHMLPDMSPHGP